MNIILFDTDRENLYPLSLTRPISDFRIGISTVKEKWEFYYNNVSVKTDNYLSEKFPIKIEKDNLWINASVLPNKGLVTEINSLRKGEFLKKDELVIAINNHMFTASELDEIDSHSIFNKINNLWDIFSLNGEEI
ncbi:MAG: putative sugar nucleotidyl transferase, partial [Flavobacteriales bacterium]